VNGASPRTLERKFIDKAGKMVNTAPERDFQAYIDAHDLPYKMNETRPFTARDRKGVLRSYDFQLDFVEFMDLNVFLAWRITGYVDHRAKVKTDLEVDGKGHKDSSDPWKDAAKNLAGLKVIHIPSYLCRTKMWPDLTTALQIAFKQREPTVYLDEYSK
jgi:hypothetical protein